jgi:hypothetical protein
LSSRYFEADFVKDLISYGIIPHMFIEGGGRGQGRNPDIPQASDTTQPDQAALAKRERRRAYQREWQRQRYHQNPEPKREAVRERYWQNPEPKREAVRRRYQQNPERAREYNTNYKREWRKRKKEAETAGETVIFSETDYWKSEPAQSSATTSDTVS